MPLFQPSNITPSSFAGIGGGTVAVADNVNITWQVNGNVPMTAYKIVVFDSTNKKIKDTGIINISTAPFYPTDNKGNPQYFNYAPSGTTWASWGLADGKDYTLQITQFWGGLTDAAHAVVQISQSFFITRTKPSLSLILADGSVFPGTIETGMQSFSANYAQAQGDSIEWVRWELQERIGNDVRVISDTGIVNTQSLLFSVDGLQNGKTYRVVCTIQTENGVQVSFARSFDVSYDLPKDDGVYTVSCQDKASNVLSWTEITENTGVNIQGKSERNLYAFASDKLWVRNDTIYWDEKTDNGVTTALDIGSTTNKWTLAWKASAVGMNNGNSFEPYIATATPEYSFFSGQYEKKASNMLVTVPDENSKCFWIYNNYLCYGTYKSGDGEFDIETYINVSGVNTTNKLIASNGNRFVALIFNRTTAYDLIHIYKLENNEFQLVYSNSTEKYYDVTFCEDNYCIVLRTMYNINQAVECISCSNWNSLFVNELSTSNAVDIKIDKNKEYLLAAGKDYYAFFSLSSSNGRLSLIEEKNITPSADGGEIAFSKELGIVVIGNVVYSYSASGLSRVSEISTTKIFPPSVSLDYYVGSYFNEQGNILIIAKSSLGGRTALDLISFTSTNVGYIQETFFLSGYNDDKEFLYKNGKFVANSSLEYGEFTGDLTFSFNKEFSGKTIYAASATITNGSVTATYSGNKATFTGTSAYINPSLGVSVSYLDGLLTPLSEDYLTIRMKNYELIVSRTNNVLTIGNKTSVIGKYTIPANIENDFLLTINQNGIFFSYNGVRTSITASFQMDSSSVIKELLLSGYQKATYLYVKNATATIYESTTPTWDSTTEFLTHFDLKTLQAGELEVVENVIDIYRENLETGEIVKLYSCGKDIQALRDFSWAADKHYKYFGRVRFEEKYASENDFESELVCPNNDGYFSRQPNAYLLMETEQDDENPNVYHVLSYWRFGNNLSAGSTSNNNAPSFLTNFTPYRLKQPVNRLSDSGTLTALLSNAVKGEYNDNAMQMQKLSNLSKSNNTFFLRDTKGNLYMVAISGAITHTINTRSNKKETTVSVPWEEVGDSKGVSIIQIPTDESWGNTEINR